MSKYFFAVEFRSGRGTTTGEPNPRTWRMNRAISIEAFKTADERTEWVDAGKVTSDMAGNCREAVTKKELRDLCLGMSLEEFNEHIANLQFCADNKIYLD